LATFGQRLKELRVEHNLTQDELVIAFIAKFPDVPLDKSKISRYERGITKPSHFDVVECLSYFFGVTPGYLMGRSKHRRATPYRKIPVLNRYSPDGSEVTPTLHEEERIGPITIALTVAWWVLVGADAIWLLSGFVKKGKEAVQY